MLTKNSTKDEVLALVAPGLQAVAEAVGSVCVEPTGLVFDKVRRTVARVEYTYKCGWLKGKSGAGDWQLVVASKYSKYGPEGRRRYKINADGTFNHKGVIEALRAFVRSYERLQQAQADLAEAQQALAKRQQDDLAEIYSAVGVQFVHGPSGLSKCFHAEIDPLNAPLLASLHMEYLPDGQQRFTLTFPRLGSAGVQRVIRAIQQEGR